MMLKIVFEIIFDILENNLIQLLIFELKLLLDGG